MFFNNVILARNRQLPDDDRMNETCRSIFKSFNGNNLSVCIGWCADQVITKIYRHIKPDRKRTAGNITQSNPKFSFSLLYDRRILKGKRMNNTGEEAGCGEETRDGEKMPL